MNVEVEVPEFEADVERASIGEWRFEEGDMVLEDETLVALVTDEHEQEVYSTVTGILIEHMVEEGDVVHPGDVLAVIEVADEGTGPFEEEDLDYEDT